MSTPPTPTPPGTEHDALHDAWLREALRYAPDAGAAPPPSLSDAILTEARAAAAAAAAPPVPAAAVPRRPAALPGRANPWLAFWAWLARPPVAAGFASVMAATLVGMMWWGRPIDETLPPPPSPRSEAAAPTAAMNAAPPAPAIVAAAPEPDAARSARAPEEAPKAMAPGGDKVVAARPPAPLPSRQAEAPATADMKKERQDARAGFAERAEERPAEAAAPAAPLAPQPFPASPPALSGAPPLPRPAAPPPPPAPAPAPAPMPAPAAAPTAAPAPESLADAASSKDGADALAAAPRQRAAAGRLEEAKRGIGPGAVAAAAPAVPLASPLAPLLGAARDAPEAWSRATAGGGSVAVSAALQRRLAELDAEAAGRWAALPAAAPAAGAADAATLVLLRDGAPAAVLRLEAGVLTLESRLDGSPRHWRVELPAALAGAAGRAAPPWPR